MNPPWKRHALPPSYSRVASWQPTSFDADFTSRTPVIIRAPNSTNSFSVGCSYSSASQAWHLPSGQGITLHNAVYVTSHSTVPSSEFAFKVELTVKMNSSIDVQFLQSILYCGDAALHNAIAIFVSKFDGKVYFDYTSNGVSSNQVLYDDDSALLAGFCTITVSFDGTTLSWSAEHGHSGTATPTLTWFTTADQTYPCYLGSWGTYFLSDIFIQHATLSFGLIPEYTWFDIIFQKPEPIPSIGKMYEWITTPDWQDFSYVGPIVDKEYTPTIDPVYGTGLHFDNSLPNTLYGTILLEAFDLATNAMHMDFIISINDDLVPLTDPASIVVGFDFASGDNNNATIMVGFIGQLGAGRYIIISAPSSIIAPITTCAGRYRLSTDGKGNMSLSKDGVVIGTATGMSSVGEWTTNFFLFPFPSNFPGGAGFGTCPESMFRLTFGAKAIPYIEPEVPGP